MINSVDIREWRGHDVLDSDGRKIGSLEAVYVDTRTDEPSVATVIVGLPTRHRLVFVPLAGAVVGPGYVRVGYSKTAVKDAPSMGTDDVLPHGGREGGLRPLRPAVRAGPQRRAPARPPLIRR